MRRPKMLLRWGDTSILGQLIRTWAQVPAEQTVVVCAADDAAIQAELERLDFPAKNCVLNSEPERGMFSSVQCAAKWDGWNPGLMHVAVVLGDQPQVRLETLQALVDFARRNFSKICQPSRGGKAKHPVIFPKTGFGKLANTNAETLKEFLEQNSANVALMESDDEGLDFDLDLPEDYESAVKKFQKRV